MTTPSFEGYRTFVWFTPQHRHATEYELVTVGQQSSPAQWLTVDWPIRFDDGREPFTSASTAVRSTRWEDYRDPAQMWQRPYVVAADHEEQALARLLPDALASGLASEINPAWLDEVLGRYYAAWPFAEYGVFLAMCYAVREALADTVEFAIAFQASDRMRHLQDIVHLMFDLAEAHPGFTDVNARDAWLHDPVLVPTRETVERIASARDWVEILVAANLAFEPLVGELVKTEFLSRNAVHNGDPVTPLVLASVRADTRRHLAATQALVRLLVEDPEHGTDNKTVLNDWVVRWGSECERAAEALAPLFAIDKTVTGEPFDRCWQRVSNGWHTRVEECGLEP